MAETGRSSTNILKPPVRPWKCGFAFQTLTKGGLGERIRSIYIPEEGYLFLDADLTSVEFREVMLLAKNDKILKSMEEDFDIHKDMYRHINDLKLDIEVSPEQRYLGKQTNYSFLYGTGERTFMNTVNSDAAKWGINIRISQSEAGKTLKKAHEKFPEVRNVYWKEIEESLQNNQRILTSPVLPFGPQVGRRRQFLDRWGPDLLRQAYAQIPQSIPPDHIRRCYIFDIQPKLKKLHAENQLLLCGENHDALLFKLRKGFEKEAKEIIQTSFETPIDFSRCSLPRGSLKIPCEIKIGENYKDLVKI